MNKSPRLVILPAVLLLVLAGTAPTGARQARATCAGRR